MNLPNWISAARIVACPLIFYLALSQGMAARYLAFLLFLVAAFSDLWDGHLARKHGLVTDTGKLLDPVADKLLLASTFWPAFIISRRPDVMAAVPWWGTVPVWVMVVIFGREVLVTLLRAFAARRGLVISAGLLGKRKALAQNFFAGGILLWYPLLLTAAAEGWSGPLWTLWRGIHSMWIGVMLALAVGLSLWSLAYYLWRYRALMAGNA